MSAFTRNSSNPLAVEYAYFTASPNDEGVQLSWKTLSQEGTDRFEVERSVDGLNFQTLATQQAQPVGTDYEYLDVLPPTGRLWYRITEVEVSGAQNRSEIREVNFQIFPRFELWPNPAGEMLNVRFFHRQVEDYRLEIYDLQGRLMQSQAFAKGDEAQLDLSTLSPGMYLLNAQSPQGRWQEKFIKQ